MRHRSNQFVHAVQEMAEGGLIGRHPLRSTHNLAVQAASTSTFVH